MPQTAESHGHTSSSEGHESIAAVIQENYTWGGSSSQLTAELYFSGHTNNSVGIWEIKR